MKKVSLLIFFLWIIILIFPFVFGELTSDSNWMFNGFLLNPIDGFTYLSKMHQGYDGSWTFQLTYSPENNAPALLFMFYLFLGHIAKWFQLPLILIFHITRIISAALLFYSLFKTIDSLFRRDYSSKTIVLIILLFGGGLGWITIFTGMVPVDFWVAEAYPFLSALVNPHFAISLAILLYFFRVSIEDDLRSSTTYLIVLLGFVLANISPFAVFFAGLFFVTNYFWLSTFKKEFKFKKLVLFFIATAPVLFYQFFLISMDPILSQWNAQNITTAPNLINFILAFSPFLIGIICFFIFLKSKNKFCLSRAEFTLLIWIISTLALLYIPLNLQRRFLVGFYIPNVFLFFLLLKKISNMELFSLLQFRTISLLSLIFAVFTNALLIISGINAISNKQEDLFMERSLNRTLVWMDNNLPADTLVIAKPEYGLFIPAFSNQRVVYGHPFESINSKMRKSELDEFFNLLEEGVLEKDIFTYYQADYLLVDESSFENADILFDIPGIEKIYQNNSINVYEIIK